MDLETLYEGKQCYVNDRKYKTTEEYIKPFVDIMSKYTDKFIVRAERPAQMTMDEKSNLDVAYSRVWVQAVMPESECVINHDEVIAMLYGIDIVKPVVKFYRGMVNRACTNLAVFNPLWLTQQKFTGGEAINYGVIEPLLEKTNNFLSNINAAKAEFMDKDKVSDKMGEWVDKSFRTTFNGKKLPYNMIINGYKNLMINQKSRYFVPENRDVSLYEMYNAVTGEITEQKNFMDRFEQTMLVSNIMADA